MKENNEEKKVVSNKNNTKKILIAVIALLSCVLIGLIVYRIVAQPNMNHTKLCKRAYNCSTISAKENKCFYISEVNGEEESITCKK